MGKETRKNWENDKKLLSYDEWYQKHVPQVVLSDDLKTDDNGAVDIFYQQLETALQKEYANRDK